MTFHTVTHTLTPTCPVTHFDTHTHTHTLSSHIHDHTYTCVPKHTASHTHRYSHMLTHIHSDTQTPNLTHTLSLTHIHPTCLRHTEKCFSPESEQTGLGQALWPETSCGENAVWFAGVLEQLEAQLLLTKSRETQTGSSTEDRTLQARSDADKEGGREG